MGSMRTIATLACGAAATVAAASAAAVQEPAPPATTTVTVEAKVEPAQEPAAEQEAADAKAEPKEEEVVVEGRAVRIHRLLPAQAAVVEVKKVEDDDPDRLDPEAMQYVQQLRPILRAELHRIRLVAKPDDDRMKAIAADSRKALNAAARDIAKQMRHGMPNNDNFPDPVGKIAADMLRIAAPHLTPEQRALYEAEVKRQSDRQKRAATRLLVAAIDDDLTLSADQRERLERAVDEKWNDSWRRALAVAQFGRQYLPALPDPVVLPILTDRQKSLWDAQKRNRQQIFGFFWHTSFDNAALEPEITDELIQQNAVMIDGAIMVAPAPAAEAPAAEPAEPEQP
jgi:hypothetical protein